MTGASTARGSGRLGWHQGDSGEGGRLDHQRGESFRAARTRRRRFSDRPQMVVHAEAIRRPAALSRGQCRRIRAGHLQGSRDHAPRSASVGRGLSDRGLRHAGQCRLHLHSWRVRARSASVCKPRWTKPMGPGSSARTMSTAFHSTSMSTTAPAPISAARRRQCSKASKARRASRA